MLALRALVTLSPGMASNKKLDMGTDEIHFAPPKKPWLKPERFLLFTLGDSNHFPGFLNGGAKWFSSIHSVTVWSKF